MLVKVSCEGEEYAFAMTEKFLELLLADEIMPREVPKRSDSSSDRSIKRRRSSTFNLPDEPSDSWSREEEEQLERLMVKSTCTLRIFEL
jgi:hypothetical protein